MAVSIIPSSSLGHCFPMSAQRHSFCWQGGSYLLDKFDNLQEVGDIQWQLALCLLLAWGIVFLCLLKGIHSAGKVSPICETSQTTSRSWEISSGS